jgi:hypothetical protein
LLELAGSEDPEVVTTHADASVSVLTLAGDPLTDVEGLLKPS